MDRLKEVERQRQQTAQTFDQEVFFSFLQPDLAFVKVLSSTSENFELRIFEFIKTFFRATQGGK